jgi:starch synthase
VTGVLVPVDLDPAEPMTPVDPERFARDLAAAINALLADPARRTAMGEAGRRRAVEQFSWASVADRTIELSASLAGPSA